MPLTVNLDKAKVITKDRLRMERKPLLEEQDVAFMRATESGEPTTSIVTEKQGLRDITTLADTASLLQAVKDKYPKGQ